MGISGWQLLILAFIVLLVFGTKKLRNVGQDMGSAIKSFRKAVKEDEQEDTATLENKKSSDVIDVTASKQTQQDT